MKSEPTPGDPIEPTPVDPAKEPTPVDPANEPTPGDPICNKKPMNKMKQTIVRNQELTDVKWNDIQSRAKTR